MLSTLVITAHIECKFCVKLRCMLKASSVNSTEKHCFPVFLNNQITTVSVQANDLIQVTRENVKQGTSLARQKVDNAASPNTQFLHSHRGKMKIHISTSPQK